MRIFSLFKNNPLIKIISNVLINLPCPSFISYWWNLGSLLGVCLVFQVITGLFLSIHYTRDVRLAFSTVRGITRDVNFGWSMRIFHANGASLFFCCLYLHLARGLYYNSFNFHQTWLSGVSILLLTIATSFIGYVLPWGQISFWGATVITNLFSAIPLVGQDIVVWLWGGFAVDNATLNRFFSLHFLLPFLVSAIVALHLFFLHSSGSRNPLGLRLNTDKIPFHPYFILKDLLGYFLLLIWFLYICFFHPWLLGDPENFIAANALVTPVHIQPEWYFLFAYAILRSIPNKLGGVVALAISVIIIYFIVFTPKKLFKGSSFSPLKKLDFWFFCVVVVLLRWVGACPVEDPYIITGQILTIIYFFFFISRLLI